MNTITDLEVTLNTYWDGHDEWCSYLEQGFALCDVLQTHGYPVPPEIGYQPSPLGPDTDDSLYTEIMDLVVNHGTTLEEVAEQVKKVAVSLDNVPEYARY